jgi:hypothetical protein
LVDFFPPKEPPPEGWGEKRRIQSVSILVERITWVVGLPELGSVEVLASDNEGDLVFLGVEYPEERVRRDLPVLDVPLGDPARLSWGSFVYVLGFPAGYRMVTRGIVSDPRDESDLTRSFTIDGVWNRGMSGGLVLAIRGDGGGLEWVGLARAAAVGTERRLVPEEGAETQYEPWVPYDGRIYLEETQRILYGITLSISLTAIRRFADQYRDRLGEQGYALSRFRAGRTTTRNRR